MKFYCMQNDSAGSLHKDAFQLSTISPFCPVTYLEKQQSAEKQMNTNLIIKSTLAGSGSENVNVPFMLKQNHSIFIESL